MTCRFSSCSRFFVASDYHRVLFLALSFSSTFGFLSIFFLRAVFCCFFALFYCLRFVRFISIYSSGFLLFFVSFYLCVFVIVALIPLLLSHTIPLIPRFFPSIFSFLTFFSSCLTFLVIFLVFFLHLLSQISFYFSTVAATDFIHLRLLCCTTFFIIVSYCEVFFSFFIG